MKLHPLPVHPILPTITTPRRLNGGTGAPDSVKTTSSFAALAPGAAAATASAATVANAIGADGAGRRLKSASGTAIARATTTATQTASAAAKPALRAGVDGSAPYAPGALVDIVA